ncbi:gliding motility-associated C-terminal domain-containing protein [Polluticoccus soli]|uniref:T9SS type B sorting domain-containing protein n=1 Tax=Polluticoccus soli TaxID=3034150 RepID=UPI0023E17B17|nr:gliding motility-associated C-terminal domain-containing protein [Flavipsychrobacter sp. JY13-12]
MRKRLLFVALLIVSQLEILNAQIMFEAPDTVCVRQPVQLISNVPGAASHYWGFCSGYLLNTPTGLNLGKTPYNVDGPTDIDIVKEGDNYYGFLVAGKTNEFKRLSFGKDLGSIPVVTNYGNFDNALPQALNALQIVRDDSMGNWHVFVTGGTSSANSEMARIDFGKSLADTPNIVNFGNYTGMLNAPHSMFIAKEAGNWIGFVLNKGDNSLIRFDMDTNISLTPRYKNLGPIVLSDGPHDLAVIREVGNWHFFITNETNNSVTRLDIGPSLNISIVPPPPTTQVNTGDFQGTLFAPNGITLIRDCDNLHAFVTNRGSHELVRIDIPITTDISSYNAKNFGSVGGLSAPSGISRVVRERDNLYGYITNYADSTITRITFAQCNNSSIPFSTTNRPPVYTYDAPGYYNIYYAVNEGTPDMAVQCKQIAVLRIPPMELSNDTTICQGDTIMLRALSIQALNVTWSPNFNISATDAIDVKAWPDYTTRYKITFPYRDGCIVDTAIDVTVHKVKADAGPDRTLIDGASTLLGGPFTTTGTWYAHVWQPAQFINNNLILNPTVNPPYDFTYFLTVTDTNGCRDVDTVVVRVNCTDLVLPNAFVPKMSDRSDISTFGLSNKQLIKLNHFRIFDRWGKMVFETTDATKRWDGTVNGEDAPMGVYVWDADAFCISGQRIQKSGNVTLIR